MLTFVLAFALAPVVPGMFAFEHIDKDLRCTADNRVRMPDRLTCLNIGITSGAGSVKKTKCINAVRFKQCRKHFERSEIFVITSSSLMTDDINIVQSIFHMKQPCKLDDKSYSKKGTVRYGTRTTVA